MGGYGAPPPPMGGYPPPGGFGMPPPPPQNKGGISGAMIALIIIVAVVVLGGGCTLCLCLGSSSTKSKTSSTKDPTPTRTPTKPPAEDNWITAQRPYVKFKAPAGWSTQITNDKEWGIFKSPNKDAVFAFTTFNQPGESTVRLSKAASVLGVSDIDWRAPRHTLVGKDRFNGRQADGSCNFHGPGGYIWYATVDAGSSDQILLIFTVSANAPAARRAEAQAAVDSLQRR